MPNEEKKKPIYDSPYHITQKEHWLGADKRLHRLSIDPERAHPGRPQPRRKAGQVNFAGLLTYKTLNEYPIITLKPYSHIPLKQGGSCR